MTINKTKNKKTLAKEILFFFAGLSLIGIFWGFLLTRNLYYESKASSSSEKINSIQIQIDSLPKDHIKELYNELSRYFVVHYKLGQDSYAIPKEQEADFLFDEFGIKKNVQELPGYPLGFSYFKQSDPINILGTDSSIVFDYVSMERFRELAASEDYQLKLYSVFAKKSDHVEWVPPLDAIPADFDPIPSYYEVLSLGTLSDFKAKMKIGLEFNSTVVEQKRKLEADILEFKETTTNCNNSKLTSAEIQQNVIYSAIAIGLLLYVLRLSIVLIVWALRTLKRNSSL